MVIKTIPLSRLKTNLEKTLDECVDSGQTLVVELPDQRLLAIQPLDPNEDDFLMDEVLALKRSARRRSVEQIQYDLWQAEKKRAILRASPSERDT